MNQEEKQIYKNKQTEFYKCSECGELEQEYEPPNQLGVVKCCFWCYLNKEIDKMNKSFDESGIGKLFF